MIFIQFGIGFVTYSLMAIISYSETAKSSWFYFPLGILAAIIANVTWLHISKMELDNSALVIKGLWWDSMLTSLYILIPIIFFGARLSGIQIVGLVLVVAGLFLTKL